MTNSIHSWYKLNLGDAMLVDDKLDKLQAQLNEIYQQATDKTNLVACYRHENNGLHCSLVVYISAELQDLVKLENAFICASPNFADTSILIIDENFLTI